MADKVEEKEDKEPSLVVIEEGSAEHRELESRDDEREEQDDEGGDERLGKSETSEEERQDRQLYGRRREGETDEQYRDRRRAERKQKKQNRQTAINRNRTELRFLESRNETLEREHNELKRRLAAVEGRTVQTQALTVDNRIATAEGQLQEAKNLKAAALDANNGEDVVKCDEIIDHLNGQLRGLKSYKQHLARGGQALEDRDEGGEEGHDQPERRQTTRIQPPKDPKIAKHSASFQERLEWFDPSGKDPESATVYAIDVALAKDGRFDARTSGYWKELERRVRAALPHKFEEEGLDEDDDEDDDADEQDARPASRAKGPRLPGGSRSTRGNNTFYLSAERKQAMIDKGVWDDPVLKAKYIKKYREWDQQNAGRR